MCIADASVGPGKLHGDGDRCERRGLAGHAGVSAGVPALLAHGQEQGRRLAQPRSMFPLHLSAAMHVLVEFV